MKQNNNVPQQPEAEAAAEPVGFGRPPKRTRFQPGKSGNRRGRPKGARGRKQIVAKIAQELHTVVENGRPVKRTTLELILLALRNRAAEGNPRAFRVVHDLLARFGPQESLRPGGYIIVGEQLTDVVQLAAEAAKAMERVRQLIADEEREEKEKEEARERERLAKG